MYYVLCFHPKEQKGQVCSQKTEERRKEKRKGNVLPWENKRGKMKSLLKQKRAPYYHEKHTHAREKQNKTG